MPDPPIMETKRDSHRVQRELLLEVDVVDGMVRG